MANFTRRAIKSAFLELLEQRPLADITVRDIVERCGINRNSFYYHFRDIPSLVEEITKESADAIIAKYPSVNSIVECYDALTEFASGHRTAIMHIYRSVNRDVFERYLMSTSHYFVQNYLSTLANGREVDEADRDVVIDFYKCTCFGLIIDWLEQGMKDEQAVSIRRIFRLKKDSAEELARLLRNQT